MGIRDVLARTDGGFISLHQLLHAMATADGVTYREAAKSLSRLLYEAGDAEDRPHVHRHTDHLGTVRANAQGRAAAAAALRWAAENGDPTAPGNIWQLHDDIPF